MSQERQTGAAAAIFGNAYLLLVLTTMSWGGNAVAGKLAVGEVSPMALTLLRWGGVVVLALLFSGRRIVADWPILRANLGYLAVMGAVGFAFFNALFYLSAHSTTAINIGILQGAIPVLVMIGAYLAFRTPVSPVQALGVAVTMLGVAVITTGGELHRLEQLEFNRGDLMMLGACALYAGYTVALRRRPEVSAIAMFWAMALAAFLATIPLAALEAANGAFAWPSPKGWAILLFVTVVPSFLAQLCFMRGVQLIGPGRAGVFVNLVPIFAASFSVAILDETFAAFHAGSLVLVLGGIAIAEWGRRR